MQNAEGRRQTGWPVLCPSVRLCVFGVLVVILGSASGQSTSGAMTLEQAGQLEQAWDEYRAVLARSPADFTAYDGFRRLSAGLGRFDSLLAVSTRLAEASPDNVQFRLGAIEARFGLKQRGAALAECRQAAARSPGSVALLADLLQRYRENSEAISLLVQERARGRDPLLNADRLVGLYEAERRYGDATREIVLIANARPDALVGFLPRIRDYTRAAGAAAVLGELGRLADPWYRARAEAEVLLGAGREREAVVRAKQGLDRDGLYGFAHEAEEAGALAAALALYQEQGLLADQARVLRKLGRNADALAALVRDQSPEAKFERAELLRLENRDFVQAAAGYEEVLKRRPGDEPAAYGLAASRLALGRPAEARAAARGSNRPTDRLLLLGARAWLYEFEFDSCRQAVAQLAARFPQSPLLNDALELGILAAGGETQRELVTAMQELETGRAAQASVRAAKLAEGTDETAEQALLFLAEAWRRQEQPGKALAALDDFARRFPQSPRRPRGLFIKADVLLRDLKDENLYRRTLEELAEQFPGSAYAPVARSLLDQARQPVPGGVR